MKKIAIICVSWLLIGQLLSAQTMIKIAAPDGTFQKLISGK